MINRSSNKFTKIKLSPEPMSSRHNTPSLSYEMAPNPAKPKSLACACFCRASCPWHGGFGASFFFFWGGGGGGTVDVRVLAEFLHRFRSGVRYVLRGVKLHARNCVARTGSFQTTLKP